jgi:hypothetical protein
VCVINGKEDVVAYSKKLTWNLIRVIEENHENFNRVTRFPVQDSNRIPPEWELNDLPLRYPARYD